MESTLRSHWENIYRTRQPHEVSWTQAVPQTSLDLISHCSLPADATIIDVGGGDSHLADHLLLQGFAHITVLDISAESLSRAQKRMGAAAASVNWIQSDIREFRPVGTYDLWHDRAAFHFLTAPGEVNRYVELLRQAATGYVIIGTFSRSGPLTCSGLPVQQYDAQKLAALLADDFELLESRYEDHVTPSGSVQNFLFCRFRRR